MSTELALPWRDAAWREEAEAWVREQLAGLGYALTGDIEQPHVTWWSTVFRVTTDGGVLWFKAVQPEGAFEARLTPFLSRRWPQHTAEILATNSGRGWTLARDAGTRLREVDDGTAPVEHWARLLPAYASVQAEVAHSADELLGLGVPDRRLSHLPGQLAAALDEPRTLRLGQKGGLTDDERARLVEALPRFEQECGELEAIRIPQSIQHDDLHDGNAFLRDGQYVFFDWGDACLSHPFHSLVVTLRALAYRHGWEPGGPEVTRLLDAYLEPWRALAAPEELRAAADLARRTGVVQRALAWREYTSVMPPEIAAENVDAVPYGLRMYLLDGPWGSWDDGTF